MYCQGMQGQYQFCTDKSLRVAPAYDSCRQKQHVLMAVVTAVYGSSNVACCSGKSGQVQFGCLHVQLYMHVGCVTQHSSSNVAHQRCDKLSGVISRHHLTSVLPRAFTLTAG